MRSRVSGEVTLADLRERVASRYPDAEPLPDPPLLDDLLRDAGWDVEWIVEAAEGSGAYRPRRQPGVHLSTVSGTTTRYPTRVPPVGAVSGHVAEARQFDERLHYAAEHGQFLILTVSPRDFRLAERALTAELDIEPRSLERALLDAMKLEAERAGADWNVVLRADADGPGGGGWQRLIALVRRAMPAVEDALSGGEQTLLLLYPGLLARYGQLDLLQRLGQRIGHPGRTPRRLGAHSGRRAVRSSADRWGCGAGDHPGPMGAYSETLAAKPAAGQRRVGMMATVPGDVR